MYIGKPSDTWDGTQWRHAALVLGYLADELEEWQRLALTPKRRGRNPTTILGAVNAIGPKSTERRRPGRPKKRTDPEAEEMLHRFLERKEELEKAEGVTLTDRAVIEGRVRQYLASTGDRKSKAPELTTQWPKASRSCGSSLAYVTEEEAALEAISKTSLIRSLYLLFRDSICARNTGSHASTGALMADNPSEGERLLFSAPQSARLLGISERRFHDSGASPDSRRPCC